jgi:hypothetical protein
MPTGERCELALPAREFGLIADGDTGQLTYQGNPLQGVRAPEDRQPLKRLPPTGSEHPDQ